MNAEQLHPAKSHFYNDERFRAVIYQLVTALLVAALGYYLISNVQENMAKQSIASGFGFVDKEAAFEIGESLIDYSAADTYGRALLVGVINTLKVSAIGMVLTTILGAFIGVCMLSSNWLVSRLGFMYVELFQNIPVLLQLFFFYALFYEAFPGPRQALNPIPGLFITNRGIDFGVPAADPVWGMVIWVLVGAVLLSYGLKRWATWRQRTTGRQFPVFWVSTAMLLFLPLVVWLAGGAPTEMDVPVLSGFNFKGGLNISPEFSALLIGLVLYTASFIAQIVRAGIQSINRGQTEAAMSIGLKPGLVLQLVIFPQALRVIVPPLTSQLLNLTKNSSLAVAIGYPDFVQVAGTTINQTGQAVEGVALMMMVYLSFSLTTSAFMNWYNRRIKIVER
ncbi:MAG: amino acid ABC transporter permease [Desulfofustis sp. PB-SRB1]|jgi:general L-amino acid transport system permease protein|nr:amino acid ABC transporter permease [Desulfofustis sp. PB-SRB1]MBM1000982.1 amino acid ABC transporter permease [Desulfofustis sp. PB-SRB1]HBH30225.1 amino acid ABC transporter permease [Desulfofustis sp.]HBH32190.1 amino acid ABC transporter permease [Desulfofustis sp.]